MGSKGQQPGTPPGHGSGPDGEAEGICRLEERLVQAGTGTQIKAVLPY